MAELWGALATLGTVWVNVKAVLTRAQYPRTAHQEWMRPHGKAQRARAAQKLRPSRPHMAHTSISRPGLLRRAADGQAGAAEDGHLTHISPCWHGD